jgi:ElaB/YqjD/DUF883 family membrane-anchored ribosome-binding protein
MPDIQQRGNGMARARTTTLAPTRETLIQDLNKIIADAEQFLKEAGAEGSEQAQALRAKVQDSLGLAKQRVLDLEESLAETGRAAKERTREAVHAADNYVHQHPWQTLGLVAGVGVLLGLLLNRQQ